MCHPLINLLKYNLSSNNTARLCEEVKSIENYAEIQKYRYGDIFELKTDVGSGTENCIISRFVLQPLVENAIIHGFEDLESGGEITVRSFFKNASLCLEVRDNGCGMDAKTLMKLNLAGSGSVSPESIKTEDGSIGVANISERLRLQFSGKAAIVFESVPGKGTTARLLFPAAAD
jgi:two-component system sensor histidine kinase YesM